MTALNTIHTRLVAVAALQSGLVTAQKWYPDDEEPFSAAEVPAVCISPAPVSNNQLLSGSEYVNGQDWILAYLIHHFPGDTQLRDRTTWDYIVPYIESVPAHFFGHQNLDLPGTDAGIVQKITLPSVISLAPATFDRAMYAAVGFRMTTYTVQS